MLLHIQVVDVPEASLELKVQGKKSLIEPVATSKGFDFFVPILVKEDGRWAGEFVRDNRDGRWFIYLTWYEGAIIVKRIKLYTHQFESHRVKVRGKDQLGRPACSTADIIKD
jgi:hypothetical protein